MRALITQADKTVKVQEVPVPEIDEWEILVKVVAVAQNPTDWQCVSHHFQQTKSSLIERRY